MPNPVPEYMNKILYPIMGNRMIELGRKKTKINDEWLTYKSFFESSGIDHVSIDIQGEYGSLPLDLTKPVDLEPADMLTNFGTTEHVGKQEPCWRNIHNLIKPGGYLVSMTPMEGDWWWHGEWYPKPEFYVHFAFLNGYEFEYFGIGRQEPFRNLDVRLKKVDDKPFVMPPMDTVYHNKRRPRGF